MIAKQIIRGLLLIVALGSLAIWANREFKKSEAYAEAATQAAPAESLPAVEGPQVVMTYFLIGTRCETCRKIEALARELADSGVPLVWITHDTAQLRRLADHAVVLVDGRVAAFGHLDELDRHRDPRVRELVGAPLAGGAAS